MKQYQYKEVRLRPVDSGFLRGVFVVPGTDPGKAFSFVEFANSLGSDGWELVRILDSPPGDRVAYFKRSQEVATGRKATD